MKVTLAQHGGLAAGIRRQPQVLDAHALPTEAAGELAKLVAAARAVPRPQENGPGRTRDAMSYTITVEDNGEPTLLRGSDTNMSPAFAALLDWLQRYLEVK